MDLWILDLNFHCGVFAFYMFLIKNVWDTNNATYLIGYCNRTPFLTCPKSNILCFVPIFYITHKMGCCRYCYCLGWYNLWCVTLGRHNYPLFRYQFIGCYYVTTTFFVCLFIRDPQCPYSNFYFLLGIFVLRILRSRKIWLFLTFSSCLNTFYSILQSVHVLLCILLIIIIIFLFVIWFLHLRCQVTCGNRKVFLHCFHYYSIIIILSILTVIIIIISMSI